MRPHPSLDSSHSSRFSSTMLPCVWDYWKTIISIYWVAKVWLENYIVHYYARSIFVISTPHCYNYNIKICAEGSSCRFFTNLNNVRIRKRSVTLEKTCVIAQVVAVQIIPVDVAIWSFCPYLSAVLIKASIRIANIPVRIVHVSVTTRSHPNEVRFRFEISNTSPYGHSTTVLPNHVWNQQLSLVIHYVLVYQKYEHEAVVCVQIEKQW